MEDIKRYAKVVSTWDRQWSAICEELKNYDTTMPKFEDILSKTESSFGSVLQTGIFDNLDMITTPLKEIRQLWRFVNESDIQKVTESRFIPQPEYVSLNRMNDKDRLYSYFSISYKDSADKDVVATGVREIRAKSGDTVWKCQFKLTELEKPLKIVDFSPKCKIPMTEEKFARFLLLKCKKDFLIDKQALKYWIIQVLLQVFCDSNMFAPIDKTEKQEAQRQQYKPFHVICDYLEEHGCHGVIYRSTVFKKGRCLALFKTEYANCLFETKTSANVDKALRIQ